MSTLIDELAQAKKLQLLAEEGRRRAELELLEAREKFAKDIKYISRLRTERCGAFRKRTAEEVRNLKHPLLESARSGFHGDWIVVRASQEALMAGITASKNHAVDAMAWHCLPAKIQAESWWHLCAQVGLVEFLARILYAPEE